LYHSHPAFLSCPPRCKTTFTRLSWNRATFAAMRAQWDTDGNLGVIVEFPMEWA